jgi:thioredoxin 1
LCPSRAGESLEFFSLAIRRVALRRPANTQPDRATHQITRPARERYPHRKFRRGVDFEEIFRVTSDNSDHIVHISESNFDADVLKAQRPVLLDFWAEWCGPCKAIAPMLSDVAAEYRDKVTIAKLNVDDNPKLSQRFNVRSIPTLILFKNGQVEGQKVGSIRKSDLVAFLDSKL